MTEICFRSAEARDLAALSGALASLSRDLGDPYRAPEESLAAALFGDHPSAWARLGECAGRLVGATLFAPVFSTAQGGAGVYVSDLWVAADARGNGFGHALLQDTVQTAHRLWNAEFLRLVVHDDNARAAAFYRKLGFEPAAGQTTLALTGQTFEALRGRYESHS